MTHWSASVATLESHFSGSMVRENLYRTLRFADWDGDGDTDVLVGDGGSIWFHERLSNGTFRKNELVQLHAREGQLQSRFEVADWNGHLS